MRLKAKRLIAIMMIISVAGVVMTQSGLGCTSLFGEQALSAVDMCFIFDCQNGALGGTIKFCSTSVGEFVTFSDCPADTQGGGDGDGGGGL